MNHEELIAQDIKLNNQWRDESLMATAHALKTLHTLCMMAMEGEEDDFKVRITINLNKTTNHKSGLLWCEGVFKTGARRDEEESLLENEWRERQHKKVDLNAFCSRWKSVLLSCFDWPDIQNENNVKLVIGQEATLQDLHEAWLPKRLTGHIQESTLRLAAHEHGPIQTARKPTL